MNKDEQRTKGIELAKAAGAAKTLAAISDKDACYEDIFKAALAEVGPDALVKGILQGPPEWAQAAVRSYALRGDLGSDGGALLKLAQQREAFAAVSVPSGLPSQWPPVSVHAIRNMALHDSAAANVNWTVHWVHGNNTYVSPNSGDMVWGGDISEGQSNGPLDLIHFGSNDQPLATGDFVYMYVKQDLGNAEPADINNGPVWFTYDASSTATAYMVVTGAVDTATVELQSIS